MKKVTLCYLVRMREGKIAEVCLAEKKLLYVAGMLNAAGGKMERGEDERQAAAREVREEQGVVVRPEDLQAVARLAFCFPGDPEKNLDCYVFLADRWQGEPRESEEMGPAQWFAVDDVPIDRLPPADRLWLPQVLRGQRVEARFELTSSYEVISSDVHEMAREPAAQRRET